MLELLGELEVPLVDPAVPLVPLVEGELDEPLPILAFVRMKRSLLELPLVAVPLVAVPDVPVVPLDEGLPD